MTRMAMLLSRGRSVRARLARIGALLAFSAQIVAVSAPMTEAALGNSAVSHVETGGTNSHYAHNEARCVACAARLLVASAEHPAATVYVYVPRPHLASADAMRVVRSALQSSNTSRAPPALLG